MNAKWASFFFLVSLPALSASAAVHYVDANNSSPVAPYSSWASAANIIQDAVDASSSGDLILVTNGVYDAGGKLSGSLSNRVMVTTPLTLQSVNGPAVTIIQGSQSDGTTNGPGPVRCVYLTNGATLFGFTLTNGATLQTGIGDIELSGGGVLGNGGAVSNCVIIGNFAYRGGGAASCTLERCVIATNRTVLLGGGSYFSSLKNCVLVGNSGGVRGGGDYCSTLNNCTLVGNRAPYGAGGMGGILYNCISYHNNHADLNSSFEFCCYPVLNLGYGNITNAPLFVNEAAGDFHLQANSPCINAGKNTYASSAVDFDGNPRIQGDTVDIGAFEFQTPTSVISYAWLQKYGLPTDGSADFIDTDGDHMNNWQEWRAGTDPTNPLSFLQSLKPIAASNGITLTWQSGAGIAYFLQRSTNLSTQPLSVFQTDIPGGSGTTTYIDTTATNPGPYFYRVGVQ